MKRCNYLGVILWILSGHIGLSAAPDLPGKATVGNELRTISPQRVYVNGWNECLSAESPLDAAGQQTPPGSAAVIFAPRIELNSVFSPDGNEFHFRRIGMDGPTIHARVPAGKSSPETASDRSQHEMKTRIAAAVGRAAASDLFSGCVLVAKGEEILFAGAYGEANRDFHIPNTLETRFNIASGTKPFTGVAIMQLVERGLVNLHDPVRKYLPDFPFGDGITLYHCLTHTSGLGHYTPEYFAKMHQVRSLEAFLKDFVYQEKPRFEPGTKFSYSNSGVIILGAVIEKVSGMRYAAFLEKNIFVPLAMKDTVHRAPEEIVERRASGYIRKLSGGYLETSLTVCPPTSATGLRTTAPDLLKFILGIHGNKLLREDTKKIMFTPFRNDDLGPYALLWDVIPAGIHHKTDNTVIGHRGGQDGFTSWYTHYLRDGITIIILSNLDMGGRITTLYGCIEAIIFGKDYKAPGLPADRYLYERMKAERLEQDIGRFRQVLEEGGYKMGTADGLNTIGYQLLRENDLPMALRFFRLNARLFPDDANVWDSLAEACMQSGLNEEAIGYYEKTLSLNPDNPNAREQLKKLKKRP